MAAIHIRQAVKRFGETEVIHSLDLDIHDGEFLVFVGPSGCGKSTILRMIAGLEAVSSGEIHIGGERVDHLGPAERGAAMVFQSYALYPHMTVQENMGFALRMSGWKKTDIEREVEGAADKLKLTHLLKRYPKQLSGGQRQRVAIGRAIVRRPSVFLFDEPLSNLDAALRVQMRIELATLHKELGTTMIYVTHDQTEAMTLGDRIAVFNRGAIEQLGKPLELYRRPANRFVGEFLGSPKINILPVDNFANGLIHVSHEHELPLSCLEVDQSQLHKVRSVGVRAESWEVLGKDAKGISGTVEFVEHLGDNVIGHIRASGLDSLLTFKTSAMTLQVGQFLVLRPQVSQALAFDEEARIL